MWVRSGQLQPVLIIYGHDETDLAHWIEPINIINFGLEDHSAMSSITSNKSLAAAHKTKTQTVM